MGENRVPEGWSPGPGLKPFPSARGTEVGAPGRGVAPHARAQSLLRVFLVSDEQALPGGGTPVRVEASGRLAACEVLARRVVLLQRRERREVLDVAGPPQL